MPYTGRPHSTTTIIHTDSQSTLYSLHCITLHNPHPHFRINHPIIWATVYAVLSVDQVKSTPAIHNLDYCHHCQAYPTTHTHTHARTQARAHTHTQSPSVLTCMSPQFVCVCLSSCVIVSTRAVVSVSVIGVVGV